MTERERLIEALTGDAVTEQAARSYDPVGWRWYDAAEADHPAKPIFLADKISRTRDALKTAADSISALENEAGWVGDTAFLLRLLDEREAEIARLREDGKLSLSTLKMVSEGRAFRALVKDLDATIERERTAAYRSALTAARERIAGLGEIAVIASSMAIPIEDILLGHTERRPEETLNRRIARALIESATVGQQRALAEIDALLRERSQT